MAMLRKMVVQGIRSFDPNESPQCIQFYSPLTLIVGQNGCGKTTIIEALKFSITGETPPNTKGGCFLNDPKLGHGYETKAFVMTEVRDKLDNKIVVSRKLKALTKTGAGAGTISVSTLEGTLTRTAKGTKNITSITSKCADLKEEMCRIMGVSDAILNHVIFCHQEDSCWPLEEAGKVKQKFDAIFNTTMYIKALKQLEKEEKEMNSENRMASQNFENTKVHLQQLRRKQSELEDLNTDIQAKQDELIELERETEPLTLKIQELEKLLQNYVAVMTEVKSKRATIEQLEKENKDSLEGFKDQEVPEEDLDGLTAKICNFDRVQKSKESICSKVEQDIRKKSSERKSLDDKLKGFISEAGSFDTRKTQNETAKKKMSTLIRSFVNKIKEIKNASQSDEYFSESLDVLLDSYALDAESVDPISAIRALTDAIKLKGKELEEAKSKFEVKEKEVEGKIQSARDKLVQLNTENNGKIKENKELEKEINILDSRLQDLEESNERLAELKDRETKLSETIDSIKSSGVISRYQKEIETLKDELRKLDEQKKQLESYQTILSNDAKYSGQILAKMETKQKKETDAKELMRRIEPQLRNLLGNLPTDHLGNAVKAKNQELDRESKAKEKEYRDVSKEITQLESQLKHITSDLETKEKETRSLKIQLTTLMESGSESQSESFEEEYAEIFNMTEEAQKDYTYGDAAKFLYNKYIKAVNKKPCCPLCKRDIKQAEKENLIDMLNQSISDVDTQNPTIHARYEQLKSRQQQLTNFKPKYDRLTKYESTEIPDLKDKKAKIEEKLTGLREKYEDLTEAWNFIKSDLQIGRDLILSATNWDNFRDDMKKAEDQIRELESRRDPAAKEVPMTLDAVQNELENLGTIIDSKSREKESKEKIKDQKQSSLQKSNDEKITVSQKILHITSELQGKTAMEEQKEAMEQKRSNLKLALQELAKKMPPLEREVANEQAKLQHLRKERNTVLDTLKKEESELEKSKDGITNLQKEITDFIRVERAFEETSRKMKIAQDQVDSLGQEIKELEEEFHTLVQDVARGETHLLNLKSWKQIKSREVRIDEIKNNIEIQEGNINSAKHRGIDSQYTELRKRRQAIQDKINRKEGSLTQVRASIKSVKMELATEPFASAEKKHREALIKKTVYEKATKDVRVYRMTLDNAVMTYHQKKMETINKYLSFYWKKIYKGNDIETIEIRTENDDPEKEKATKVKIDMNKTQRKVYNYRVVMIRRGIPLDMRGRCSAGQKVLASIIIRLALAQTFGTKCGIIALDEPTTNLDQKNINSLAQTLSELALTMTDTKTFQLIVITHDQDFIDTLLRVDPVEYYFKVSRNQMGYSQIEKITK